MARKNPVPERERLICARLRFLRKFHLGMSRVEAARRLGIDSSRLASYEHGRVPLSFGFADLFCRQFNLNQAWLAEKEFRENDCWPISDELRASIDPTDLFSEVYHRQLRPAWVQSKAFGWFAASAILGKGPVPPLQDKRTQASFLNKTIEMLRETFTECSPRLKGEFLMLLIATISRFSTEQVFFKGKLEALEDSQRRKEEDRQNLCKSSVDNPAGSDILPVMSSEDACWKALVTRLKVATAARGAKAYVARKLKVTRQAVNNWLSDKGAPSAELTLRLLNWVQQAEESQKQNPGSALTQPGQKTRVNQSKTNEKANSNPQER